MAGPLARLYATFGLDTRDFDTGLGKAKGGIGSLTNTTTLAAAAGGAALGSFVTSGIQEFAQLDTKMREVFTLLPGISEQAKNELTQDARDFAVQFGVSTDEAIGGLYNSLSAGVPQDNVFEFMATAQKAATGGVADLTASVGLLSAVTKGYGDTSVDATNKASDLAFTTVKLGQTTFPELAASIGKVIPQAEALNISQEELFGTMATLTGVTGNTAEVATQLKAIETALIKPTADLAKVFKEQGIESGAAAIEAYGLQGTLDLLKDAAGGSDEKLGKMLSSSEALTAALALTGAQSGKFTSNIEAMGGVVGATDTAFAEMDSGIEASGRKIAAFFNDLKLTVGQSLEGLGPIFYAFGPQMGRYIGLGFGAVAGIIGKHLAAPAIKLAVAAAGSAAGVIYQGAVFVGSKFTAAAVALWGMMGGPRILAAATAAGAKAGAAYVGAMSAGGLLGAASTALAAAAPLVVPITTALVLSEATKDMGRQSEAEIKETGVANASAYISAFGQGYSRENAKGNALFRLPWEPGGLLGGPEGQSSAAADAGRQTGRDYATAMLGALSVTAGAGGQSVSSAFGSSSLGIAGALSGAVGQAMDIVKTGIEDDFGAAVKAVKVGFGNVKQALKNPPHLISAQDRITNMEARVKKSMKELNRAVAADDPINIAYWTKAVAKQQQRIDAMKRKTGQKVKSTRDKTKSELEGLVEDIKGIDLSSAGRSLIGSLIDGIKGMWERVKTVAGNTAALIAGFFKSNSPPKVGPLSTIDKDGASLIDVWLGGVGSRRGRVAAMGDRLGSALQPGISAAGMSASPAAGGAGGGGVHVHVHGNVYGGQAGLRQLARELEGATRITQRNRRRNGLAEG